MPVTGALRAASAALLLLHFLLLSRPSGAVTVETCSEIVRMRGRAEWLSIMEFGGVGDGRMLNKWSFRLLYVPPGVWLTGPFNLTSHMMLYLARGAVIKATQAIEEQSMGGEVWWNMRRRKSFWFTRPHLVEFMHSRNIIISNVVLRNYPFWNIHPVYCENMKLNVTFLPKCSSKVKVIM